MTKKIITNKNLLIESRKILRKAKSDYVIARDLSLDSDLLKSSNIINGSAQGEYDELHRTSGIVVDLKHTIKMAKYRMKREVRKMRKV